MIYNIYEDGFPSAYRIAGRNAVQEEAFRQYLSRINEALQAAKKDMGYGNPLIWQFETRTTVNFAEQVIEALEELGYVVKSAALSKDSYILNIWLPIEVLGKGKDDDHNHHQP